MIRYPQGPLTPHAAYHLLKGRYPMMTLRAFDESAEFSLLGAKAIPDRTMPETVILKKDGLKGLIGPWDMVDQKGATEDGVTNIDALHGPVEVEMKVLIKGRTPKHMRRVREHLLGSIHNKHTSELSWIDQDLACRWWGDVRWFKGPPEAYKVGESCTQELTLVLRADRGFWRTENDVDSFRFSYETSSDTFDYTTGSGLGAGWKVYYYDGAGGGVVRANGDWAIWEDAAGTGTSPRGVICLRAGFTTTTDNQVVSVVHASGPEFGLPVGAFNDIWGRCRFDGSGNWAGDGIRLRYGSGILRLSRFNGFAETVLANPLLNAMVIPPLWTDQFDLVCGYEDDPRLFKVLRNGSEILSHKESGTGSLMGANYRAAGLGMRADGALIGQVSPGAISKWSAGDNSTVSQSGFVRRLNIGDQPMPDRYTVYGPGIFRFGNGPGSTEMVEFGPLLPNQVVLIDTSPQRPRIRDLTSIPPKPQELEWWQQAMSDLASWASAGNVPPLIRQIESAFGIVPPQGNLYSLLKGRWSKDAAIPPKQVGVPAQPYYVKVSIDDGNADSKILVAGTPLRRQPV